METALCKLTLVLPSDAADRLADLMMSTSPPIQGFTTWQAEGHGASFRTASSSERVRGRVERTIFVSILERSRADSLLEEVRVKTPIAHMIYWVEPVSGFGRLTKEAVRQGEGKHQS